MAKKDSYLKLTTELQSDRRIKPEADNTVDPNREGKKKKKRNGQVEEENEDESDIGDDNEVLGKKKINRKMRDAIKKQEKTNKLMGFLDDIKAAKKEDSDEDEDLEDVDLSEDEDEDGEGEGDEDMDDEEGDDDGLGDDDDDDLDGLDDDY